MRFLYTSQFTYEYIALVQSSSTIMDWLISFQCHKVEYYRSRLNIYWCIDEENYTANSILQKNYLCRNEGYQNITAYLTAYQMVYKCNHFDLSWWWSGVCKFSSIPYIDRNIWNRRTFSPYSPNFIAEDVEIMTWLI